MNDLQCGISTGCFYKTDILRALPEVRAGGFDLIEVCSFPAHLDYHNSEHVKKAAALMERLGIGANSFHAPFTDRIDISSPDAAQRVSSVRELMIACDAAAMLHAEFVVLHPGPERAGRMAPHEWYERMRHAADSLNEVAAHCRHAGLMLLLENMLPHLMFGHVSDMMFLLGAIRETNVGTCLDTGHAFLSRELRTVVHKLSGHLHMIHVNDNMGDHDAHLSPGEGAIDWISLFRQLRQWDFHGPLILELADSGEPPAQIMERARKARAFLQEIMNRLPVPP